MCVITVSTAEFDISLAGIFVELLSLALILLSSITIVLINKLLANVVAVVVLACGMGLGNASAYKLLPKFSNTPVAGVSAWVSGLGALGGVAWPVLLGLIATASGSVRPPLLMFVMLSIVGTIVTIVIHVIIKRDARE